MVAMISFIELSDLLFNYVYKILYKIIIKTQWTNLRMFRLTLVNIEVIFEN